MSLYLHLVISFCPPYGVSTEMQSKSALAAHIIALYFNRSQEIRRKEVNNVKACFKQYAYSFGRQREGGSA